MAVSHTWTGGAVDGAEWGRCGPLLALQKANVLYSTRTYHSTESVQIYISLDISPKQDSQQ